MSIKVEKDVQLISRSILDLIDAFINLDKKARKFGTDKELFLSEIHFIDFVGTHKTYTISEIAKEMNITKGAVSQMVKKLEKKGLLEKYYDVSNQLKVFVKLTEKGEIAYQEHKKYHQGLDNYIAEIVKDYNLDEKRLIHDFLKEVRLKWS